MHAWASAWPQRTHPCLSLDRVSRDNPKSHCSRLLPVTPQGSGPAPWEGLATEDTQRTQAYSSHQLRLSDPHPRLRHRKDALPEIAKPLNPTASTRKEMATPLVWEKPTTRSKVASMPKPAKGNSLGRRGSVLCHLAKGY